MKNLLLKLKNDRRFRYRFTLQVSIVFNLAYAIFLFVIAKINDSKWFLVMSFYYALLSIVRCLIGFRISEKVKEISKLKALRFCGFFLLFINLVVSVVSIILIFENNRNSYHQIIVIALATYTFYAITVAIVGIIRQVKSNDAVLVCKAVISLTSASVSLLTLTDTMLTTFGSENTLLRSVIMPLLSVGVSIFIILMAIFMIKKSNLYIRKYKYEKER